MLEKLKKWKKGSALVFVFMLLVLFAAFSVAMIEVSKASKGLSTTVKEVKDAQYFAEVGVGYYVRKMSALSLASGSKTDIETWLDSMLPGNVNNPSTYKKQYVGGSGSGEKGWFALLSRETVKDTDFLLTIVGATSVSQIAQAQPSFFSFLDTAYAQTGELRAKFEVLVGPNVEEFVKGGGIYAGTVNLNIADLYPSTSYGTYKGYVVSSNFSGSIAVGETRISIVDTPPPSGMAQYATDAVNTAISVFNNGFGSPTSETCGHTTTTPMVGVKLISTHVDVPNSGTFVIGDGQTSTFIKFTPDLCLKQSGAKMRIIGPAMVWFNGELHFDAADTCLIMDCTKGPVHIIMGNSSKKIKITSSANKGCIAVYKDNQGGSYELNPTTGSVASGDPDGFTPGYKNRVDPKLNLQPNDMHYNVFFGTNKDTAPTAANFPNGRKIGMIFLVNGAKIEDLGSGGTQFRLGQFISGDNTNQYAGDNGVENPNVAIPPLGDGTHGNDWSYNAGSGAWSPIFAVDGATSKKPTTLAPTAEHFWIVASGSSGNIELTGNNEMKFMGVLFAPERTIDYPDNVVHQYGLISGGSFTSAGNTNSRLHIDGRIQTFPPEEVPGSYHVKWLRRVE